MLLNMTNERDTAQWWRYQLPPLISTPVDMGSRSANALAKLANVLNSNQSTKSTSEEENFLSSLQSELANGNISIAQQMVDTRHTLLVQRRANALDERVSKQSSLLHHAASESNAHSKASEEEDNHDDDETRKRWRGQGMEYMMHEKVLQCRDSYLPNSLVDPAAWELRAAHCLSCGRSVAQSDVQRTDDTPSKLIGRRKELENDGMSVLHQLDCIGNATLRDALFTGVVSLVDRGFPPVCVWMFDETWKVLSNCFDAAKVLLNTEAVELEPSPFAWMSSNSSGTPGAAFTLPHRDYPTSDAVCSSTGAIDAMSCWIPITDATPVSGCMHALPLHCDPHIDPTDPLHLRVAEQSLDDSSTILHFNIGDMRALPAKSGSVVCWRGDVVHFGGRFNSQHGSSHLPRISIACTFRRKHSDRRRNEEAAANDDMESEVHTIGPLNEEDVKAIPSMALRAKLVCQSLMLYSQWHVLSPSSAFAQTLN